jgi:hypothetical protein
LWAFDQPPYAASTTRVVLVSGFLRNTANMGLAVAIDRCVLRPAGLKRSAAARIGAEHQQFELTLSLYSTAEQQGAQQ